MNEKVSEIERGGGGGGSKVVRSLSLSNGK